MADQQEFGTGAHAQQQKAVFVSRIVFIKELHGKVIIKNRLRFFEGNAIFLEIDGRLGWARGELDHLYIVLSACGFEPKLPRTPAPCFRMGRLARHRDHHGEGLGEILIGCAVDRC